MAQFMRSIQTKSVIGQSRVQDNNLFTSKCSAQTIDSRWRIETQNPNPELMQYVNNAWNWTLTQPQLLAQSFRQYLAVFAIVGSKACELIPQPLVQLSLQLSIAL